jgi:formylglycine-generating enzyme required for sulfatase activity
MPRNDSQHSRWPLLCMVLIMLLTTRGYTRMDMPFSPQTFDVGTDTTWRDSHSTSLRMNGHYIAGPTEGQNYKTWLRDLRTYRDQVRAGMLSNTITMNYKGVRSWVRLGIPEAKALKLTPGERLTIGLESRWLKGNNQLCFAFDWHRMSDDKKTGWSSVLSTIEIPTDGKWHTLTCSLVVPPCAADTLWLRPIAGMDATYDPTPGQIEIRRISYAPANREYNHALMENALDRSIYQREDLAWAAGAFTCHFTFMYDRSIYNPETKQYTLDAFLDDGVAEFGGYDAIILWPGYPRMGVDQRNQFDFHRDVPGGPTGLRELVRQAHERNIKAFIAYNPWDVGTRREGIVDDGALAELAAAAEIDGVFLDTMRAGAKSMRQALDSARPGIVLSPEGAPSVPQLSICNSSWAQWFSDPTPPGLLQLKWIEPRHLQYQIRRWDQDRQDEIATAFFNGSGMLVWENVFGVYNPWSWRDRHTWKRAVTILRHFQQLFVSDELTPFYPTHKDKLFAHCWQGDGIALFTLLNTGATIQHAPLLDYKPTGHMLYYDLWSGKQLPAPDLVQRGKSNRRLKGSVDHIGCLLAIERSRVDASLKQILEQQRREAEIQPPETDTRNSAKSVVVPDPVQPTTPHRTITSPVGMVFVKGERLHTNLRHMRRECGCYPDQGTPKNEWQRFLWGDPFKEELVHSIGPLQMKPFFIDEAEVTNAQYKTFMQDSGYCPFYPDNFLKHWPNGEMPPQLADHPVVYVDLDDARAYAAWAGKRLPGEYEWQLAAQGTDGRKWPWGSEFDADRCNQSGQTTPVHSHPGGRSPSGCYHMAGNVWEWTESFRDDGHTRFVMIRGGSYFDAKGSGWFVQGGPQPCDSHAKFLLMWPGLDRCATVGFRCVIDAQR